MRKLCKAAVIVKLQENQSILAISTTQEIKLLKNGFQIVLFRFTEICILTEVWGCGGRVWGPQEPPREQVPLVFCKPGLALVQFCLDN